jgi:hypothetical protein
LEPFFYSVLIIETQRSNRVNVPLSPVINPAGITNQMEGGLIQPLSLTRQGGLGKPDLTDLSYFYLNLIRIYQRTELNDRICVPYRYENIGPEDDFGVWCQL